MSDSMLVRASRDGDQFHYLWAARHALQLLRPQSGLVAVTIEGAATSEFPGAAQVEVGDQLIDIAEYYGDTDLEHATLVRYMQLKHSTLRVDEVWQPSGLEKTIHGFAKRYAELQRRLLASLYVKDLSIEDATVQRTARDPGNLKSLKHSHH